jgi:predicted DNA-binding protein (MmcQ/YjbR family)
MNARALQDYCRSLPGATEDIKWGADLVFSVGGKMFAGFHADGGLPLGFPCSDEDFDALTARAGIIPAPYAARFGWVSVQTAGALRQAEAKALLKKAYGLVLAKLPKGKREAIAGGAAAPSGAKARPAPPPPPRGRGSRTPSARTSSAARR